MSLTAAQQAALYFGRKRRRAAAIAAAATPEGVVVSTALGEGIGGNDYIGWMGPEVATVWASEPHEGFGSATNVETEEVGTVSAFFVDDGGTETYVYSTVEMEGKLLHVDGGEGVAPDETNEEVGGELFYALFTGDPFEILADQTRTLTFSNAP